MNKTEDKSHLLKTCAHYGLYLGLFFVLKYFCIIFILEQPLLGLLYVPLTIAVPVIVFMLTRSYRNWLVQNGSTFSAFHGWQFGVLLYLFASIIVMLPHYYYYAQVLPTQIDPFFANIEQITQMKMEDFWTQYTGRDDWNMVLDEYLKASPFVKVYNDFSSNLVWGALLCIPNGFILRKR